MNGYQWRKAKLITAALIQAAAKADTPIAELVTHVTRFSESSWRTVSFVADVPIADVWARAAVVCLLQRISVPSQAESFEFQRAA